MPAQAEPDPDQLTYTVVDTIEADVLAAVAGLKSEVATASRLSVEAEGELATIHDAMNALKDASGTASRDISGLAAATEEMAQSAEEIGRSIANARGQIDSASLKAETVSALLDQLMAATGEIHGIADAISEVARRTNLLALNATIEAARAGDAGKGFAVVAHEVKALSQQTNASVDDIRGRVARLERTAQDSAVAVRDILTHVHDAHPLLQIAGEAGHEQAQSAGELSRTAAEAARFVEVVTRQVVTVDKGAMAALQRSVAAREAIKCCAANAEGLGRRIVPVIRQTRLGDRRQMDRYPVELNVTVTHGGRSHAGATIDISGGGVLLARISDADIAIGETLALDFGDGVQLSAMIVASSALGLHCRFHEEPKAGQGAFTARLAEIALSYQPQIKRAQEFAAAASQALCEAIRRKKTSQEEVFDVDYQPIPGTNPLQHTTRGLPVLERVLKPVQDRFMQPGSGLVFAISVDRNGYIPIHNEGMSEPQRPDDPEWNAAHCRNRRIFDDRSGITAGRSTRPFVIQAYRRDMGGGNFVMVREVDAPIFVNGAHWGGARMGYNL